MTEKKTRVVKTKNIRAKRDTRPAQPKSESDMKFCERWLVHHDHNRAYLEAGLGGSGDDTNRAKAKVQRFSRYLQSRIPAVEKIVAKEIAYERKDILAGIARIANANALDYLAPYQIIDPASGVLVNQYRMKRVHELTRDQAAAIDSITYDAVTGAITYTLPTAKTRLAALATLGEQAAGFSKNDGATHQHLHLHNVDINKLRQAKGILIDMVGPNAARQIFGMHVDEQEQLEQQAP